MQQKYDLTAMLKEIEEDEGQDPASKMLTQEEIKRLVLEAKNEAKQR
ncbi:MAG: hypothetical protein HQL01_00680 [Nitrospirae bacterium]|nr:hypothetical protein [Nitrospirota bacterium]